MNKSCLYSFTFLYYTLTCGMNEDVKYVLYSVYAGFISLYCNV